MKTVLHNLLKIKSIVTIVVIAIFAYGVISGILCNQDIMVIVTMVVTFYFAKKGGGSNDT